MAERKTAKPKTFEQMLARLDEIVRSLEKGDAPLEESLSLYTEGAELIRTCTKQLDEAEQTAHRSKHPLHRRTNNHGSFQRI